MRALLRIKVRPYYLFHCDPVIGAGHFRTSVWKGLEIMEGLARPPVRAWAFRPTSWTARTAAARSR